jgi:glycine/D-amino acid oxidase-like deaminating enzyme
MKNHASYSYWLETCGDDLTPRPALSGSVDVDVAILGAGYSGLWTAYYLLQRQPSLKIAIVEKEIAGFGASGRNGSGAPAISRELEPSRSTTGGTRRARCTGQWPARPTRSVGSRRRRVSTFISARAGR